VRVLLFGKNGQLGWELQRSLAPLGELVALAANAREPCGDLADLPGIRATVRAVRPDVIVNAGAYTAVDRAESEFPRADLINSQAPGALATAAAEQGALLIHFSTDYVFDGSGSRPWREGDPIQPCNAYGRTKAGGERAVVSAGCRHLLFRTSWVYAARGHNFLRTMLTLAGERESLRVVGDQFGVPSGAELIADASAHAIAAAMRDKDVCGTYHLAPSGETSWHQYAVFAVRCAQRHGMRVRTPAEAIQEITTSDYPTAAKRPFNSRLDTTLFKSTFGLHLPDWREGVERTVGELIAS